MPARHGRLRGRVKWFDRLRGFGFLERDDGQGDVFLHFSAVRDGGLRHICRGIPVEFDLNVNARGAFAADVVPLDAPPVVEA